MSTSLPQTIDTVLADLDKALASRSEQQRAYTMHKLTDMFIGRASQYDKEQFGVFDAVIGRLASNMSPGSRLELSERLADIPLAPHGVVRQLALDDIEIARPVLTRSVQLTDQDLVAIAATKGRDHMLAITERPDLREPVTDYLVAKGDRVVNHSVAANKNAKFTPRSLGLLATRAITDDALQFALGQRPDVPDDLLVTLSKAAQASIKRRLESGTAPAPVLPPKIRDKDEFELSQQVAAKIDEIQAIAASGQLDESRVVAFANEGDKAGAICAISILATLSQHSARIVITGMDRDAVLVVARAMGWSWQTARALMRLRPAEEQAPHMVERAKSSFESLNAATAERVLQFIRVKEQSAPAPAA